MDIKHLSTRTVILKITGVHRAISGQVTKVEDAGIWVVGDQVIKALAEYGFPAGVNKPALFVPLHSIEWLIAPSELALSPEP